MVDAVTSDAEKRQVQDSAVKLWLRRLKEAAYDADDVLDEFSYKVLRRSEKGRKSDKVRDFISSSNPLVFHIKMARRIKEINLNFKGYKLPQWMTCSLSNNCLPNLVILCIKNCFNCERLPALGMLPCLKTLLITGLRSVKLLGEEFYYQENEDEESSCRTMTTLFPSLEYMSIGDMPSLEKWITPPPPYSCFPSLEYLDFHGGSKLTSIPDLRLWTSLRTLKIICHGKLKESIPYDLKKSFPFLEILSVDYI